VVDPVLLKDCDVDYPDGNPNMRLPSLRGLAVDKRGAIFAAGTGCHCVVKITPDGKTETLLKVDRPWSPTGIAEHQGDLYILEYTNANGSPTEGWLPRVRKRSAGGKVTTLVTIDANGTATVTP
jgi:sugar lactone lactonase YvrE